MLGKSCNGISESELYSAIAPQKEMKYRGSDTIKLNSILGNVVGIIFHV